MKKGTGASSVSQGGVSAGQLQEKPDVRVLTRYDWIGAPVICALIALWLFFNIYSAINWDDLLYMSLAQCTWGEAWILNRYGHVYILKLFSALFFDTILGCRVYWCFLFAATSTLIYWNAKLLAGAKSAVIGIIAVVLVYMEPLFGREAGSPLADFTVMFFVMLAVFIYLYFLAGRDRYTHWFLMLLGLIFFWTVKSKEIGICLAVLFLGLGRDNLNCWHIGRHVKDVGWVILGIIAGSLILMTLDAVFVRDFWFSVRPSNIKQLFGTNLGEPVFEPQYWTTESWFAFFTTRPFFVLFILYVVAGFILPIKDLSFPRKIIWSMPLFLMLFLTFSRRCFYVVPRYFSPVMPVMAVFAAQIFDFDTKGQIKFTSGGQGVSRRLLAVVSVFGAFIVILSLLLPRIDSLVSYYKLQSSKVLSFPNLRYDRLTDSMLLYMLAIMPLALSGLLAVLVLTKKKGLPTLFFASVFLFALILSPLRDSLQLVKTAYEKSRWRYEACRVFRNEFIFNKDVRILVSKNLFQNTWLLGRDAQAHCHMFNIYFNASLEYRQFIDGSSEDILKGGFDYAVLLGQDAGELSRQAEFKKLLNDYELKQAAVTYPSTANSVQLVLLKKK